MIRPRQLLPLTLPLAIAVATAIAQPGVPPGAEAPTGATEPAPAGADEAAVESGEKQDSPTARNESPFEYRPSEEISEDLPVSFPVDI